MKVMLVDDEESIVKVVEHIVLQAGYEFCYTQDGNQCLTLFEQEQPDLVILDVMIPEINGFDLCGQIREVSDVPIIFLSAKGDIVDKSIGFKLGADDYLTKPFSSIELSLRIEALLRRGKNRVGSEGENKGTAVISFGQDWQIFLDKYEIRKAGEIVEFTSKEFAVLAFMASNSGQVFTREQLLDHIWGEHYCGDTNNITVFIRKIREKIEDKPAKPKHLLTVWGVGYKFNLI